MDGPGIRFLLALALAPLLILTGGCGGEAVPAENDRYRAAIRAMEARATAEAAGEILGEMARQATAIARQAEDLARQATAVAQLTREAREATRSALEAMATRQALEERATRQALELQATATAQAFWLEATRVSAEATRAAEATREARQLAPTATAQARAIAAAEQALWWETHVVIPARAMTMAAAGLLALALAAWAALRVLDAIVLRIRVVRGKDGQILVIMPEGQARPLIPPDPEPSRPHLPAPPSPSSPSPSFGNGGALPPVAILENPPPEVERLIREAQALAAMEAENGDDPPFPDDR